MDKDISMCEQCGDIGYGHYICPDCGMVVCDECSEEYEFEMLCEACADTRSVEDEWGFKV